MQTTTTLKITIKMKSLLLI